MTASLGSKTRLRLRLRLRLYRDYSRMDWNSNSFFFQLLNHKGFHKLALVSFLQFEKLRIFAKFGGCGTKTKLATLILILNFSRVWQYYFLSLSSLLLHQSSWVNVQTKLILLVSFISNYEILATRVLSSSFGGAWRQNSSTLHIKGKKLETNSSRKLQHILDTIKQNWFCP